MPGAAAWLADKPLPSLPSPTLTNPDAILPSTALPTRSSPPPGPRRPPSPPDLAPTPARSARPRASRRAMAMGKKDKLAPRSQKMMWLRSRTGSSGSSTGPGGSAPRGIGRRSPVAGDLMPSSPILQDVGNLAPEVSGPDRLQPPEAPRRRASGSSCSDLSAMARFLEKPGPRDRGSDDEPPLYDGIAEAADAQRRRQAQQEYNSAVLSKRAEQILAHAKKRLNAMEGNLRGARDVVAPLTAANLKRAASLGSRSAVYGNGRILRYTYDDHDDDHTRSFPRRLSTQHSSPAMGSGFPDHRRGCSGAQLPDRPHTALDHHQPHVVLPALRAPPKTHEQVCERALRVRMSKSYESLGAGGGVGCGLARGRPVHSRQSTDQNHLEPLTEDDERRSNRNSGPTANNGLGIYRPSSRTSDLRDQVSSLKGKISSLKEKAREDSLRRQSQTRQKVSPFNDALHTAPESFYASSDGCGESPVDTNAGASPVAGPPEARQNGAITGSRKASADQIFPPKHHIHRARVVDVRIPKTPDSRFHIHQSQGIPLPAHRRTTSGRVVIDSAQNRYSHRHNSQSSQSSFRTFDMPTSYVTPDDVDVPSPDLSGERRDSSCLSPAATSPYIGTGRAPFQDATSVYIDAPDEPQPEPVAVAHEDRDDAFDYKHFFLHSAMGSYSNGRRGSGSSEGTASSSTTARGPALAGDAEHAAFHQFSAYYPPPTPETPDGLREIERNIHGRTRSNESIASANTYATADEVPLPPLERRQVDVRSHQHPSRVVSPGDLPSRQHSRQDSHATRSTASTFRPAKIYKKTNPRPSPSSRRPSLPRTDSSSDRADSGVGISARSVSALDTKRPAARSSPHPSSDQPSTGRAPSSPTPPLSPRTTHSGRFDPVTVAVQALLDPHGHPLGLRNQVVLFGVVESLRQVIRQLQAEEEATFAARMLRSQLDEAKRTLDGL